MGYFKTMLTEKQEAELNAATDECRFEDRDADMSGFIQQVNDETQVRLFEQIETLEQLATAITHRVPINTAITLNAEFDELRSTIGKCRLLLAQLV